MSIHIIAAEIARRRKELGADSAENVEQVVLGLLQNLLSPRERIHIADVKHFEDGYWIKLQAANAPENEAPETCFHTGDTFIFQKVI